MTTKHYFDGFALTTVEVAPPALPDLGRGGSQGALDHLGVVDNTNDGTGPGFTKLDPVPDRPRFDAMTGQAIIYPDEQAGGVITRVVQGDPAVLPNLVPTAGAMPSHKFADPPPGSGEGAAVGRPSGRAATNEWNNNPLAGGPINTVETDPAAAAAAGGAGAVPDFDAQAADFHPEWTKAQLGEWIAAHGAAPPASKENKEAFISAATAAKG